MKKVLALALSLALIATLAISGTVAYLQDTDEDVNTMTLGNVKIEQHEYERAKNDDGTLKTDTIDGQTSYVLQGFTQDKPLLPIVGDPNEPGDSPAYAGYDDTTVRMSQVDSYGGMQVFAGKNAQDKFVTVENTGKSDAYVRTIVAIEVGSTYGEKLIMTSSRSGSDTAPWVRKAIDGAVTIDGNNYMVFEYVYRGAADVNRHVNGILPAGDTTYPSLCQVYLKHYATNEDLEAIDGNGNGTLDILVLSQAVQAQGFSATEEKSAALNALDTAFGEANAKNVAEWLTGSDVPGALVCVTNDEELQAAVAAGETEILLAAGTYNISNAFTQGKTLTLTGKDGAVITPMNEGELGADYGFDGSNVTFNNITFDTSLNNGSYKGFARMTATYNDCSFKGAYCTFATSTFNNCEFELNGYLWTWGAEEVTFNNCEFTGDSRSILAHGTASTKININDCEFAATAKGYTGAGDHTAVVEIDPVNTNTYTITFTGKNIANGNYAGWTRIKDGSTGHVITGV